MVQPLLGSIAAEAGVSRGADRDEGESWGPVSFGPRALLLDALTLAPS